MTESYDATRALTRVLETALRNYHTPSRAATSALARGAWRHATADGRTREPPRRARAAGAGGGSVTAAPFASPGYCSRRARPVPDAMLVAVIERGSGPAAGDKACVAHARELVRADSPFVGPWLADHLKKLDAAHRETPCDT